MTQKKYKKHEKITVDLRMKGKRERWGGGKEGEEEKGEEEEEWRHKD